MPRIPLWGWLTPFLFTATLLYAQPFDGRGVVAIRSGSPGLGGKFEGTGFHIGNGVMVTARHVVEGFDGNWYAVLAAKNAQANILLPEPVGTGPLVRCASGTDICFFYVDMNSIPLRDTELSEAFELNCLMSNPWPKLDMLGFSSESPNIKPFTGISIQSDRATFATKNGTEFLNVIETDAQTSPGLSGSPVTIAGTRTVLGIHSGFSKGTQNQAVTPFHQIIEILDFHGRPFFDPQTCRKNSVSIKQDTTIQPTKEIIVQLQSCAESNGLKTTDSFIQLTAELYQAEIESGLSSFESLFGFVRAFPSTYHAQAGGLYEPCVSQIALPGGSGDKELELLELPEEIITFGDEFEIRAKTIIANNTTIRSFPKDVASVDGEAGGDGSNGSNGANSNGEPGEDGSQGGDGQTGGRGQNAGRILVVADVLIGKLSIQNDGLFGGIGGAGGAGGNGGHGGRGRGGVDGIFDCRSGPGNGGAGGNAGAGGNGSTGEDGGDGGEVVVSLGTIASGSSLSIRSKGGQGGRGGEGGAPGIPGDGGLKGTATLWCSANARSDGPIGATARPGAKGSTGVYGKDGQIEKTISDAVMFSTGELVRQSSTNSK